MTADRARELTDLWAAFSKGCNTRVPLTFACDEQLWLRVSGHTFREFYTRPEVHLKAQLEGKRWFCEHVEGDMPPGLPDEWALAVQLWMEEDEFFGCEVIYQEDDYAWARPLDLDNHSLLAWIADLDPEARVRGGHAFHLYEAVSELADGMEYLGRPVRVVPPGQGTHGVFTKAAEVRGLERLCLDLVESPGFAEQFLRLMTEKTIERIRAWHRVTTGAELQLPHAGGWGCCDDSLQMIGPHVYADLVAPCHERLYSAMSTGRRSMHLCGHAEQHYVALHDRLGVTILDGPGPFVDHAYYLERFGPDFRFAAQTDHSILERGTPAQVREMMRRLLTPGAKQPGRFSLLGYVTRHTPLENVRACYEAALEFGRIQ
ncbi:MAG TPA: uroporphyrinogen decarboxylase family protein [Armatimonadota bacterium]|nr:uroporphyrinogen decarboxylase family protein [Armatimonadota bacterium]